MDLSQWGKSDGRLAKLLAGAQEWQRLDGLCKQILPHNLHAYVKVACVTEGCLVLLANNPMAASRLRMIVPTLLPRLQGMNEHIREVRIKLVPHNPVRKPVVQRGLSEQAVAAFRQTANQLQHHPELAAALNRLVAHHEK